MSPEQRVKPRRPKFPYIYWVASASPRRREIGTGGGQVTEKERPPATLKLLSGSCVGLLPRGTKGLYVWLRQGAVGEYCGTGAVGGRARSPPPPPPPSIDLHGLCCLTPSTTARLTSCLLYASPKPATKTHVDHMCAALAYLLDSRLKGTSWRHAWDIFIVVHGNHACFA